MRRHLVLFMLVLGGAIGSRRAEAANGGVSYNVAVQGAFQMITATQNPGVTWTFTTSNLSSGADTVIHVQDDDDPQGGFIAGNDDYNGTLASQVVVPPIATTRYLRVIVRRYGQNSAGTCALTGTPSTGQGFFYSQIPLGGDVYYIGALAAGAHVTAAELQGGTSDTVLLVVDAFNPSHAFAFDDDDGVGFMSWVHLPAACSNGCDAVLANFSSSAPTANTNLVWDEDADTTDYDSDGLGQSLETFLGTDAHNADSDQDGINDGDELLGRSETAGPNGVPVKFPYMGALPLRKDIFLEVDWQTCDPNRNQLGCPNGPDSAQFGNPNNVSVTEGLVAQIETDFAPVRVHLDLGRTNTNPNTWTDWGNWGGAHGGDYTNGTGDETEGNTAGCEGLSPERVRLFHGLVSFFSNSGGHTWPPLPQPCTVVTNYFTGDYTDTFSNARVLIHEVGHSVGLLHGGRPWALGYNYKPHYRSLMNYLYGSDPAFSFSHGDYAFESLNPTSLSETSGLGNTDPHVLTNVQKYWCNGGTCVNFSTGAIDWNRDGTFSATNTEGEVPLWDYSQLRRSEFTGNLADGAMSWVSVGGAIGDQLWIVGRSWPGNVLQYASVGKTRLNAQCGGVLTSLDEGIPNTDCAGFNGTTTDVPGNKVLAVAPGVAEVSGAIMLVFQQTTGTITAKKLTINSSTGAVTYGADVTLPGGIIATQDITALSTGSGVVTVWATGGNPFRLQRWTYTNSTNTWSGPVAQTWDDAAHGNPPISPIWGIGATRGYQDGSSTLQTYAAIASNPSGALDFARYNTANHRWTKIASWDLIGSQPFAYGRPGLAYQKRPGQASNTVGRFYMAFNQQPGTCGGWGFANCEAMLVMTEGNMSSGSTQRLKWLQPAKFTEPGLFGGVALLDDVSRDVNLRGLSTYIWNSGQNKQTWFAPAADGITNGSFQDMDDRVYVQGGLRGALCLDGGAWPTPGCTLTLP